MVDVASLGAAGPTVPGPTGTSPAAPKPGGLFHEILSDLNPLQYIPVVGTLYRAITGDQGNPTLRFVASIGTSFALGGPVGVAITAAEEVTGIDPARMAVTAAMHLFHIGHAGAAAPAKPASPDEMATALAQVLPFPQLPAGQAYDADTLNMMELRRLQA